MLEATADGQAVLLVPGFTGGKEDFRLVLPPLAAAGYRAFAYDQRGQFESPGPHDPAAYSVESLATDLLHLVRELGSPVHAVGHSFGGLVCRAALLREPAVFRSLTLLSSGPAGLTGPRVAALQFLRPLLTSGGLVAVADALDAISASLPAAQQRPPDLTAFLRRRFLAHSPTGMLAMAEALTAEPDRVEELAAAGVPLLVMYGEHDDAWSPQVQAGMAARLGSRHVVIPRAIHAPAVENPTATVAALIAFFAEVGG